MELNLIFGGVYIVKEKLIWAKSIIQDSLKFLY
jgi:hypothetical protein